jgi:hypothetical protein
MTTTRNLPQPMHPDFYDTPEQCEAASRLNKKPLNPRYSNFTQAHFTAGDEEQFQTYRGSNNGDVCIPDINVTTNIFVDQPFPTWEKYRDIGAGAVIGTFRYIFNKFKKGIFVKIQGNKVAVFLPFSKSNFTNEWSSHIHIDPKYRNLNDFLQKFTGSYKYNSRKVNQNVNEWYANNCIVRYDINPSTRKPNEGDTNVGTIKNMLVVLCAKRTVPDIEFFMNRRDFPLLTRDGTEPYDNIWGDIPLVSYNLPKYLPILSMCRTDKYADILSPTHDDWARVQSLKGMWFPRSCRDYTEVFDTPWKDKKKTAVFRGASTGCGVTIETNPRLRLAYIGATYEDEKEGEPLLDVGITKWNLRPRKTNGSKYLQSIDVAALEKKGVKKVGFISLQQQSTYRYIINVDGHVSAFRLSIELGMGSVILLAESKWKLWYSDLLVPYRDYVPVKSDLSDLIKQVKWCRDNDDKCQEIVSNSTKFFNTYLQERGILDYLQKTLVDMKSEIGIYLYNDRSPLDVQLDNELLSLSLSYPETIKSSSDIQEIPLLSKRSFGLLQGVHWVVNMALHERNISSVMHKEGQIFANKLGIVSKYRLGCQTARASFPLAVKTTSDPGKSREHIHDVFVGTKAINSLLKHIPNFTYTFGLHQSPTKEVSVINEFIQGQTLFEYLQGSQFTFDGFLSILGQVCLAIQVAQNRCGLVHYDLVPWNIVLQPSKGSVIDYVIGYNNVIRVRTDLIPVIIDYGKSHVIVDQEHHGFVNMFKVSTIQDMLSLLLNSISIIRDKQKLVKKDFFNMMVLADFITGTKYRKDKFVRAQDLRIFLRKAIKYTAMIYDSKYELEQRTPMDLFKWIYKIGKKTGYSFTRIYSKVGSVNNIMNRGNSRQVFEYILSNTVEERAQTYFDVFSRLKHCTIPQPKNLFFVYYAVQTLISNLETVNNEMELFLTQTSSHRAKVKSRPGKPMATEMYKKAYQESLSYLDRVYGPKIREMKEGEIEYTIKGSFSKLEVAPYNNESFLNPKEITDLLRSMEQMVDLSSYQEIISSILLYSGKYQLNSNNRKHYLQNFSKLLKTNPLYMQNNSANLVTIQKLAGQIYSQDKDILTSQLPGVGDCSSAQRYLKEYISIIDMLK